LPTGGAVTSGRQHGGHRITIHPASPGLCAQLGGRLVSRACGPVRPRLGPRMVEVGGSKYPPPGANGTARQTARIAGAVQSLMVLDGDSGQRGERG
jgi:hypothetical protein